jgi:uncharacterized protein (TIGR04540 family)
MSQKRTNTVKLLTQEIKTACDAYMVKQMSEKDLKDLIFRYSMNYGIKLFDYYGNFKPKVRDRLGIKRCRLLDNLLAGIQIPMF